MSEDIRVSANGDTATITIAREARRNSLDHHAAIALRAAFADLSQSDTKAVVLTGQGGKAFCAGDDIKAYKERSSAESRAHFKRGLALMDEIAGHPCVVIAAIEGYCMGGGLELALACDFRVSSEEAVFALPEIRKLRGLPTWGGMTRLPQLIGLGGARRLAFLGERWSAEEAQAAGLVERVVPEGAAVAEAQALARDLAGDLDRDVVARAKGIMNRAASLSVSDANALNLLAEQTQPFEGRA